MEDFRTGMLEEVYEQTLLEVQDARRIDEDAKWKLQKLTELHKQLMDERKVKDDRDFREKELKTKELEAKTNKRDRIIKAIVDGAAIVLPIGVSSFWMAKSLKFEETGTYTSRSSSWISNHLKLFKK